MKDFLRGLAEQASRAVAALAEHGIPGIARVDRQARTFAVADEALVPLLLRLAAQRAPAARVSIEPAPEGLLVGALVDDKRVTALLALRAVAYEAGRVRVTVSTPAGVTLEGRPLADLFARLVARLFGGSWVGEKLLGLALPSPLVWNGAVAHLTVTVAEEEAIPQELRTLVAAAEVTRADGWTTFALGQLEALEQVWAYLKRLVGETVRRRMDPGS